MSNSHNDRAERVLTESRYDRILDSMGEGCQIISPEWKYLYVNEAATKCGYQSEDRLTGSKILDVYLYTENTEIFRVLCQFTEQRQQWSMENEFSYSNGSKRRSNRNIRTDPERLYITSANTSEYKRVKWGIEQLSTMPMDMLCIVDIHKATFIKATSSFPKSLEFSKIMPSGKSFQDIIHPDNVDAISKYSMKVSRWVKE